MACPVNTPAGGVGAPFRDSGNGARGLKMGLNKTHYETAFISTWWHLSDTLTIEEAVLLILSVDPEKYERSCSGDINNLPLVLSFK